ncbi:MAG: nucleotidyltransferase domain-containing protein [Armatimonadota bacterium]|nr:nucleotidyltransferase domain-containing protein [Armatimonadota bacterium]
MTSTAIEIPLDAIKEFCRKWRITEFALFGSVLGDDFRQDSDVDVLVSFEDDAPWSLYEWPDMLEDLKGILGREVDLVERESLRNPFRRRSIISQRKVLYAA